MSEKIYLESHANVSNLGIKYDLQLRAALMFDELLPSQLFISWLPSRNAWLSKQN